MKKKKSHTKINVETDWEWNKKKLTWSLRDFSFTGNEQKFWSLKNSKWSEDSVLFFFSVNVCMSAIDNIIMWMWNPLKLEQQKKSQWYEIRLFFFKAQFIASTERNENKWIRVKFYIKIEKLEKTLKPSNNNNNSKKKTKKDRKKKKMFKLNRNAIMLSIQ